MSQEQQAQIDALEDKIDELTKIIKPMAESYAAAVRIGKWSVAFAGFISIMIGIALGLKELLSRK